MAPIVGFRKKNVLQFKSVRPVSLLAVSNGQSLFLAKSWAEKERDGVRQMEATRTE